MKIKLGEEQHNCMSFLKGEGVNTGCSLEYVPNILIKLKDWIQLKEWTSLKLKEMENELKEAECFHQKEDVTEPESEEQVPEVIVHAEGVREEMQRETVPEESSDEMIQTRADTTQDDAAVEHVPNKLLDETTEFETEDYVSEDEETQIEFVNTHRRRLRGLYGVLKRKWVRVQKKHDTKA
jgi:hypothetical protein